MLCFAQQNLPKKIIGEIPSISSDKLYLIQVGAFKISENADDYAAMLKQGGLTPVYESYLDYTRVMITGITAKQVVSLLMKLKELGFDEVIIREDNTHEIVEEYVEPEPEPEPEEIVIEEEEIIEETIPVTRKRDIFCRTWVIVNSDKADYHGFIILFSDDGTLLITDTTGESHVSKWRWYGNVYEEFEYTHNNWKSYGRATIHDLDETTLTFNDSGYNVMINGHSSLGKDVNYELVPIENFQ